MELKPSLFFMNQATFINEIHSFIPDISIAPLQILCRSCMPKRHRHLRVKDKVPTWQPERDSNPRPFGRKATNLPMSHHAPQNDDKDFSNCLLVSAVHL